VLARPEGASVNVLEPALAGRPLARPLLAPLFAALAAEVEELSVPEFLADPGRRARIYADLARSLRVDVLVVNTAEEDPAALADLLRRVRAVVPEPTLLGVTVSGPATVAGEEPLAKATQRVIAAARAAAEAGAGVVFVREAVDAAPDGYARAVTPLWGSLKFFRAVGVLRAPWASELRGPFLPCVTAPVDAPHALAVAPGDAAPPGAAAALITHTEDLAGHIPVRDIQAAVARLR
jgi:hypothetical protein